MSEIGEAAAAIAQAAQDAVNAIKFFFGGVKKVFFKSGIDIYIVKGNGSEEMVPSSASTPHWNGWTVYPAVYVRQGGAGETKTLQLEVSWTQKGYDGAAKIKGKSADGKIEIEGSFSVSGLRGSATVDCTMTKKPDTVKNYATSLGSGGSAGAGGGGGIEFEWEVEAGGETLSVSGPTSLLLYFIDQKPKPIAWSHGYKAHYLRVIHWATLWADGKQGSAQVFPALWDKFSDGTGARVPHATTWAYWKTQNPVQLLNELLRANDPARGRGWSCMAAAHLFMEMLALHGIQSCEVVISTPSGAQAFLVKNWNKRATPIPNWYGQPTYYYGGSWIDQDDPPLKKAVPTSLRQMLPPPPPPPPPSPGSPPPPAPPPPPALVIDIEKQPGVPAQGQSKAPLAFYNHWIVRANGKLWDTSYGGENPDNTTTYANAGLAGWLIGLAPDTYSESVLWVFSTTKSSEAWVCQELSTHVLQSTNGSSN
jgi:hypothetical protein